MKVIQSDPNEPELLFFNEFTPGTTISQAASAIRSSVGVGQPFFAFANESIPAAVAANPGWDPTNAPLVSAEVSVNEAAIIAMLSDSELQALPNDKVWAA